MNKEFIPYEQALELKELGFDDEKSFAYYDYGRNLIIEQVDPFSTYDCYAPLYQQAFRWFREKYELYSCVQINRNDDDDLWYEYDIQSPNGFYGDGADTYEEAELACLKKLIELAKNK